MARAGLTFTSGAAFGAWMEDEYLSALTIADLAPEPSAATPDVVRFTWWHDAPGTRTPFRLVARGVRRWALEGARDGQEITVLPFDAGAPGVELAMEVPGRLVLACDALTITRGRSVKKALPRRPFTDYAHFSVAGAASVDAGVLCAALSDEPSATLGGAGDLAMGPHTLRVDGRTIANVFCNPAPRWLSIARADATDAEWHRCQALLPGTSAGPRSRRRGSSSAPQPSGSPSSSRPGRANFRPCSGARRWSWRAPRATAEKPRRWPDPGVRRAVRRRGHDERAR